MLSTAVNIAGFKVLLAAGAPGAAAGPIYTDNVPSSEACTALLVDLAGWNGSQELPGCDTLEPDRSKCPHITMTGTPGQFKASASGAWQN